MYRSTKRIELDVNVSDQPILIEVSPNQGIKGGTVKEIKILPETGDLQASTSKALIYMTC